MDVLNIKEITGFEGYFITNTGNVISYRRYDFGKVLVPKHDKDGYRIVRLYKDSKTSHFKRIGRLVAEEFILNPDPYLFNMVNHIDNDILNDSVDNLEWCDNTYNQLHSVRTDNNSNCKKVALHSPEGGILRVYNSARDAGRLLGIDGSCISKVCRGERKTANGSIWTYHQ